MKTTKKKTTLRRSSTIAIYMNTTEEFKKDFYNDADRYGLSASAFAGLCLRMGHRDFIRRINKKTPRVTKKKAVTMK